VHAGPALSSRLSFSSACRVLPGWLGWAWYFSAQLLTPDHSPPANDVTVRLVTATSVELDRTPNTIRQGTFGLEWIGGHAIVGKVISTANGTVTRTLQDATATLHVGDHVVLTSQVYQGNPEVAFGIPSNDVEIPGELGTTPAWYVPGRLRDFVIVVHGTTDRRPMVCASFQCWQSLACPLS